MDLASLFGAFGNQGYNNGNQQNALLQYLMSQQPSAGQSIASALPFLSLPKQQAQFYQPYNNTIAAMGDTNSAGYQNIYNQQKQQGQQNLAESIAELSRQNRKLQALGRSPLLDNERGGEAIFRNLTQGYQSNQNQAAQNTQGILGQQAQGYLNQAGIQSQLAQNKAGIHGNLFGAAAKLFGL